MVFKIALFFLFSFIILPANSLYSQCFASPGNPVAGSTNLGVLDEGIIRTIGFYQYNYLDRYYKGSDEYDWDVPSAITSAYYNYAGLSLGYGITEKFTLETEIGYFINKTQNYRKQSPDKGTGLSNAIVSGKYNVYRDWVNFVELTLSAGVKIPFSTEPQSVDGVDLPINVQPSTGNFGAVIQSFFVKEIDEISGRIILINRYENNFSENELGYNFGDKLSSSLFLSKHLANPYTDFLDDITLILQLRHEYSQKDQREEDTVEFSGSNLFFIAPQINYNLDMIWNFSLTYDIPVYQYYNGIQLANTYGVTFSVTRDIGFGI